jgi:Ca2+-binding RTX toxin-like protein
MADYTGTTFDDIYLGTPDADLILGLDGNDQLAGNKGDDRIDGGGGRDLLLGGEGNDTIDGGNGADTLYGGIGNDILSGGSGLDFLSGDAGADSLRGGGGADTFYFNGKTAFNGGTDTILDFNFTAGDKLSFAKFAEGTSLTFVQSGSDVLVYATSGGFEPTSVDTEVFIPGALVVTVLGANAADVEAASSGLGLIV